jgi:AcrR family transcriptional regulator
MLYHYFGNKEGLFRAVLENAYARIRSHERDLKLENLDPATAIRQLVAFTFQYFVDNPEFIRLLNNENLFKAGHIKNSDKVRELHFPLVGQIAQVLDHGARDGVFRKGVDPVQLYVTIAAVGYFYLSNADTLGTIFGRDLLAREALDERLGHCQEVVLGYLRP